MASVQLHDKVFKPYIDRKEIEAIIDMMAADISKINDDDLLVVIVLNGSIFFCHGAVTAHRASMGNRYYATSVLPWWAAIKWPSGVFVGC